MERNQLKTSSDPISFLSYRKHRTMSHFTLIELLIVVAIIVILAAILLPALTSALNKSRAIHCLAGMKQLGLAVQNYLDQHNDTIIVQKGWEKIYNESSSKNYMNLTSIAYDAAGLKNPVCKKDDGVKPWIPQKYICSVISEAKRKAWNGDPLQTNYDFCSFDKNCSGHLYYFRYYGMLMGGSNACLIDSANNYYHRTSRLRQASGSLFWSEGAYQLQKSSALGTQITPSEKWGFGLHSGRTNVLFFDGHAGSVGHAQTVCTHSPPSSSTVKTCQSCRFWAPYVK